MMLSPLKPAPLLQVKERLAEVHRQRERKRRKRDETDPTERQTEGQTDRIVIKQRLQSSNRQTDVINTKATISANI